MATYEAEAPVVVADPNERVAARIGRVVIGRGRDAVDVALTTQYGNSVLKTLTVWADEVTAEPPRDDDADELEAAEIARPSIAW